MARSRAGCYRAEAYRNFPGARREREGDTVQLRFDAADEAFRREVADWLAAELSGAFASARGRGGPGDETACIDERLAWERRLGEAGWIGLGWPTDVGGRGASLARQVIFHEEASRARAAGRTG